MFKKFALTLTLLATMTFGISQLAMAVEIYTGQLCCPSTFQGGQFAIATSSVYGWVDCYYLMPDNSVLTTYCYYYGDGGF
ncbi:MAG: hypothetical protein QNK37_20470 [Acidobacteriota bacterium]|nr:hypothetical protein [Acidobacteriota bacterium]